MVPAPGTRAALPSTTRGLGQHFTSPRKARNPKKTQTYAQIPGRESKRQRLLTELGDLLGRKATNSPQPEPTDYEPLLPDDAEFLSPESFDEPFQDNDFLHEVEQPDTDLLASHGTANTKATRDGSERWKAIIPTLVHPFLEYLSQTLGKPLPPPTHVITRCVNGCDVKKTSLVALYYDYFSSITVHSCECASLAQVLLYHGLFPTAPSQPRIAVSTELLSFYRALFERSCDAVNALASALNTHYIRRGFRMTDKQGNTVHEPFRRSLGRAIQWYDLLHVELDRRLESILSQCRQRISAARASDFVGPDPKGPGDILDDSPIPSVLDTPINLPDACSVLLSQRCPACFGGNTFGRSLVDGADIHVATDGNFHHRHRRSAGDTPFFYEPTYFLSKTQVDAVGRRIEKARKCHADHRLTQVPNEVIDQCESSYEAADGKKQKTSMETYDDTGVMALICRHDIPLFFANIDTPGEQQKYSVALVEHLFSLLPTNATVVLLYDIGCVLERSIARYDFLSDGIRHRLRLATTAMHAYGHEWACQLVYNPRLTEGLGLSDGEGTERLWSRFIKLIGIERSSARQRRIWLLDRHASAVGGEMLKDLGSWLKRRLRKGVNEQGSTAQAVLESCGITTSDLHAQWKDQRSAQLSIRAHAPARLKRELDSVLALQADLDSSERTLQATRAAIEKDEVRTHAIDALDSLERTHGRLLEKIESLYTSLNVQERFPELDGVNLDFVRILLLARDLKINIRKRAIGSFFEWDKLDRAVGGKDKALGTKLHQQTRKAIAKRQPALMAAIRKFNRYCEQLQELYDPACAIPLPTPLPTKLADLRNDQTLLEDVWISPSNGGIPRWLEDSDVRDGIRALLKRDRCREEQQRLGMEADNMCRWFGHELATIELALCNPENSLYVSVLQHQRDAMLELQAQWPTPLATAMRYASQVQEAVKLAHLLSGVSETVGLQWLQPVRHFLPPPTDVEEELPVAIEEAIVSTEQLLLGDILDGGANEDDEDANEVDDSGPQLIVTYTWEVSDKMTIDFIDVQTEAVATSAHFSTTRVRPRTDGFPQITFEPKDIERLASDDARLNDVCINGCAALLYSRYLSPRSNHIAIFSTHDLSRIHYNATDDILWRTMSWTNYWQKDVWILPIHRPSSWGHWVVCTINLVSRCIHLFDSLADQRSWKKDLVNITSMISRLLAIATQKHCVTRQDVGDWTAVPVTLNPVQTNDVDCGLWVLAHIAAVVRGCDKTGLRESDMSAFRNFLLSLVLQIVPVD